MTPPNTNVVALDFTNPKTHGKMIVRKAVIEGLQNAFSSHSTHWPSEAKAAEFVLAELDKIHPWERYLRARMLCIKWFHSEGKTDKYIAKTLSMDEMQVRMISEACENQE